MKMLILFFLLILYSINVCAQGYLFRMYRFQCSELFDIKLTKPKRFKAVEGVIPFRVNEKMSIGSFYQVTLESKEKDCLFLYPYLDAYENHNLVAKNMVYGEIKAALFLNPDNDVQIDTAKYIKMITKDGMKDYFNADTVYIYKMKLPKPYKEIFNECIGINAIKTGHPSAMIKILLTEEGKKKEEEYMKLLFKSICYPDIVPEYNQEKSEKTHKKLKFRSMFHGKKQILF